MRVCHSLSEADGFGPCALTIGNFDGVHIGHRALFHRVVETAARHNWHAAVLTFDPHPTKVVAPPRAPRLLSTIEQRLDWMRQCGIDRVLILPFDEHIAALTPRQFVEGVLVRSLGARSVFVGDNFRFGNKAAGDTAMLREMSGELGFSVEIVPAVEYRGRIASSTEARRLIDTGNVARAARLLTRPYALEGRVVAGHGVGSKQTVPTLNLATRAEILPASGVYITRTTSLDDPKRGWNSISNIGLRPTFGGDELSIETFLLSPFDGDTPREIRVGFLRRLREERKFETPEALKAQIYRDAARAQAFFRRTAALGLRTSLSTSQLRPTNSGCSTPPSRLL